MKKLQITEVNNGWIIRVLNQGLSPLKVLYGPQIYVFNQPEEFCEWTDQFFDIPKKMNETESAPDDKKE